ncbi:GSU2403 family nucleotidyltransferase fold protein [Rhodophyticola sp.]|uniref:GSU2403 family nucleotidyltransferase fold protein n=1 Tax=Rhodophyticola sp. TaxID=2680032 RepID=UPI003D2CA192
MLSYKLIIADRRRDGAGSLKSAKDREQAAFLIEAMAEDRPDDLARALATALEVGPRWRGHIGNSLEAHAGDEDDPREPGRVIAKVASAAVLGVSKRPLMALLTRPTPGCVCDPRLLPAPHSRRNGFGLSQ